MSLINSTCLTPTPTPPDLDRNENGEKTPTLTEKDKPNFYELADISKSNLHKRRQQKKNINKKFE